MKKLHYGSITISKQYDIPKIKAQMFFSNGFSLFLYSVNAKIKAIEAKLKMMADNPDADYSGPSAYSYNKPTEKKRTAPYSKQPRRTKR